MFEVTVHVTGEPGTVFSGAILKPNSSHVIYQIPKCFKVSRQSLRSLAGTASFIRELNGLKEGHYFNESAPKDTIICLEVLF